jgi:hypothetical protein
MCSGLHRNKLILLIRAALPTYLPSAVDHDNNIYEKRFYVYVYVLFALIFPLTVQFELEISK